MLIPPLKGAGGCDNLNLHDLHNTHDLNKKAVLKEQPEKIDD